MNALFNFLFANGGIAVVAIFIVAVVLIGGGMVTEHRVKVQERSRDLRIIARHEYRELR